MKTVLVKILSIIICIVTTAFTLSYYAKNIQHLLSIHYNWLFELLIVLGMVVFQYMFIFYKHWTIKLDYYYKMLSVSLIGSLLLWPLLLINHITTCSNLVNLVYFFAVVMVMFFIHKKRVAKMALPCYLSYTYILYRFIILLFII